MDKAVELAVTDLNEQGAHVAPMASLLAPELVEGFEKEAAELVRALDTTEGIFVPTSFAAVFSFALSPRILGIVEAYLGCPPALTGTHARRDVGPEVPDDLRCWHLDLEDERMIRIIIYLHDVDIRTGPFEFVPRPLTSKCQHLRSRSIGDMRTNDAYDPVDDAEMRKAVPDSDWVACTGPRLTAVMADTAAVFHHTKPHRSERRTLTLSYTSRSPRFPQLVPTPGDIAYLTADQRACLFVQDGD
jgi:hypothetical protein